MHCCHIPSLYLFEVSRQLRRDKAELEQRLKAAEMQAINQDQIQHLDNETDKSALTCKLPDNPKIWAKKDYSHVLQ